MPEHHVAFDEFKVFYESTERVTDRRLSTNRWNYSVCVAVLGGIALLLNWGLRESGFFVLGVVGSFLLASVASVFAYLWLRQIENYKELNNAKFAVLNEMAPKLRFPDTVKPSVANAEDEGVFEDFRSYQPFEKEWERLTEARVQINVAGKGRLSVMSAGAAEQFMPRAFTAIFIAVSVATLAIGIANWDSLAESTGCILGDLDSADCQK